MPVKRLQKTVICSCDDDILEESSVAAGAEIAQSHVCAASDTASATDSSAL